ncbi:DNA helicase UvrD [Herbaspirillum rubrisubalbicans Os34]|uniref:DNA 3'-5' helicase II n=1 Tax=Herbaspirillum rubrisubalbicans Os34 TaxID=1235827 RepID=A0A6M3ZWM7_9BURK|nr:UvrD-helicase domain-containing protein [Herbaspirillum rubrisubalbicans]QJQ03085.1 DNA helicase UvrD [Herbaspirillum rubrisubalbicans Os34]
MSAELDLFAHRVGSVMAPAGCGKTHLIATSLKEFDGTKPVLILTHTNAGVAALKVRMQKNNVPSKTYRIATLDGFAIRLIGRFPGRSNHNPDILKLETPKTDYPAVREAAKGLLQSGHLNDVLQASYSHLWVDEYQDCNATQHQIVAWAAQTLPTCVLGDPMQAIFGFGGNQLVNWEGDVLKYFPSIGTLAIPWRWQLAGTTDFGNWLLTVRTKLAAGEAIDLRSAPREVTWIPVAAATADEQRRDAARTNAPKGGSVLVIGDSLSPSSRHMLCSQTPGATVVEGVELSDLLKFGRAFNPDAPNSMEYLVEFATGLMTGVVPSKFLPRIASIRNGSNKIPPTPAEATAVDYVKAPSLPSAIKLLDALASQKGAHVYRPELLRGSLNAMNIVLGSGGTLETACVQVRERSRHLGRGLSRKAIGSTLLLKGLESDVAVVLQPEKMSSQDLYVAMTRGAKQLVICSEKPVLQPRIRS